MAIRVNAPAKINLCLHVLGQRPDGLHMLDSLVVFLECGEWVELRKAAQTTLRIIGPQLANMHLAEDNLVLRAAHLFPAGCATEIILHKTMPISSGIGGGSADAAATLKAMAQLWELPLPPIAEHLVLGADVPACMESKPVLMQGVGDLISAVQNTPPVFVCLVNSGEAVSTTLIFNLLVSKSNPALDPIPTTPLDWVCWLRQQRNDLQSPAIMVEPVIASVLSQLQAHNPILSRMSGSGATCFAIFKTLEAAKTCARDIQHVNPNWWTATGPFITT
tara:strand:- start:1303 stop:2133 length:831 start_codon:yes stop_codon:yes gene_type:complete